MRNQRAGFMLIELILYSVALAGIVMMLMSYAATFHAHIVAQARACTDYAHACAVSDLLMHDIQQASADKTLWKVIRDGYYVWTTPDGDIGWENTEQGVVRSSGSYDVLNNTWTQREHALIAAASFACTITPHIQAQIIPAVDSVVCSKEGATVRNTIALRSGVVV